MEAIVAIGVVLAGVMSIVWVFTADQRRQARKDPTGEHTVSAAIMDFDGFFNPGRQHEIDEKRRQEMTRHEVAPNDPTLTKISLEDGIAVIRLPTDPEPVGEQTPSLDEQPGDRELPPADRPETAPD
ncbi:MAG: DUF6191 domain-containing protein [Sporichthyaceae bacterium]|nr:DUF6191 domain-containing protein [Sporichthyaceae bacterium]